jgi:hypothetical protein
MSQIHHVTGRLSNGELRDFEIEVSNVEPWTLRFRKLDDNERLIQATDLFIALQEMRAELEEEGCLLLCAGARPDVAPSGMSRSMGGGRKAYFLKMGSPVYKRELVDIFSPAAPDTVGTVQQQRKFFQAWLESLKDRP